MTTKTTTEAEPKPGDDELEDDEDLILDVAELAPARRKIRTAGGALIEIISPKELSLQKRAEVDRLRANFDRLQRKTKLTRNQLTDAEQTLDKLARKVLVDVDDEVFEELELLDKEAVVTVFTTAFGAMLTKLAEGTVKTLGLGAEEEDEETPES